MANILQAFLSTFLYFDLKFVPVAQIDNKSSFDRALAWCWMGDKLLLASVLI